MKRNTITVLISLFIAVTVAAGNYGTDHFAIGEYKMAKTWFEQNISQNPAESNYYLGEIAWAEGNAAAAAAYFEKGLAADPLYMYNYIGKGKTLLKTNQKEAEILFATALKKYKKNVAMNLAVVKAYEENGMNDMAAQKLLNVRKISKKSPDMYIYDGDKIMAGNSEAKLGEAASSYEQAMYFDPENTVAQIKYGQVYLSSNASVAIETMKKIIAAHPDYLIAYKYLATGYAKNGVYPLAIENFKTFFQAGTYTIDDLWRFASVYFFTDKYKESMKLINEGLAIDPNHFVLNRLRMYNASKTKNDSNAIAYARKFFSLRGGEGEESNFIYKDDLAYATILADSGYYDQALSIYNKVLSSDDEKINKADVYKEMAGCYSKMKEFAKAGEAYESYIQVNGIDYTESGIFFQLGTSYYYAAKSASKDSTEAAKVLLNEYVVKADSAFATTCRLSPESPVGYMWRGNVNVLLDPESTQGLAKPFYETVIDIILKKTEGQEISNGYRKQLITAYNYLSIYYFLKDDKEHTTLYCNKILELEPNHVNARAILEELKKAETAK